jgi:hypothetical protein
MSDCYDRVRVGLPNSCTKYVYPLFEARGRRMWHGADPCLMGAWALSKVSAGTVFVFHCASQFRSAVRMLVLFGRPVMRLLGWVGS